MVLNQFGLEMVMHSFQLAVQSHQIQRIGQTEEFYIILGVPLSHESASHDPPSFSDSRHHIPIILVVIQQHDSGYEIVEEIATDYWVLYEELAMQVLGELGFEELLAELSLVADVEYGVE